MAERGGLAEFPAHALEPVAAEMYANGFDAKLCVLTSIAVSQRRAAFAAEYHAGAPVFLDVDAGELWRRQWQSVNYPERSEGKGDCPPAAGAACCASSEDDRAEARS